MSTDRPAHLYDSVGADYDTTRRADPYIAGRLAHHLALTRGGTYLDLACGSGNYSTALSAQGGRWHGADQSKLMLDLAAQKANTVAWCQADAADLPYADATFSGVIVTCAIHHFNSIAAVFREAFRVLAAGRLVIFTDTHRQMRGYWLNEYFPDAMEKSIVQMPDLHVVESALTDAGFSGVYTEPYTIQTDLQDFFLYSGKHHPEMYLSESVRLNITTFASLGDPSEVSSGCQRLQADIGSGHISQVMQAYDQNEGDYLFVVAEK